MQKMPYLNGIVEINNSFAIDENGDLWGWAESINDFSPSVITTSAPVKIQTGNRVNSINEADGHMVAIFDDGSVHVWGQMFRDISAPCLNGDFEFYYGGITDYPWLTGCPLDYVTIPLPTVVPGVNVFP